MIIGIFGGLGYGKTLLAVYLAYKLHTKLKFQVFSNIKLNFPFKPINIEDFLEEKLKKGIVILDEAYAWLEARASTRKLNRIISYIIFQSRKRDLHFVFTSQLSSSVDKRLRELCDYMIIALEPNESEFRYFITDNIHYKFFKLPKSIAKKYFNLYDTREIVIPFDLMDFANENE